MANDSSAAGGIPAGLLTVRSWTSSLQVDHRGRVSGSQSRRSNHGDRVLRSAPRPQASAITACASPRYLQPQTEPGREDEQGGIPLRSLSAAQPSVTLVHSLMTGVHVGATLKYMRGLGHGAGSAASTSASDLLDDRRRPRRRRRRASLRRSTSVCWRSKGPLAPESSSGTCGEVGVQRRRPDDTADAIAAAGTAWRRVRR